MQRRIVVKAPELSIKSILQGYKAQKFNIDYLTSNYFGSSWHLLILLIHMFMRIAFIILLLIPFFGLAQTDCKIKSQKDIYTKEIKLSTGLLLLQGGSVSIQANKTEIDFLFSIPGGKCFDDASTASIIFDSTRVKGNQKNGGTMNCDGLFHFIFRNTPATQVALQNLATKKILSIRFKDNSKKETELILSPEQREKLSKMVSCIIKEAKTLL